MEKRAKVVLTTVILLLGLLTFLLIETTPQAPVRIFDVTNSRIISNTGAIKTINIDAFWDLACTNKTTAINWGIMSPGSSKVVTIYVKNIGNVPLTLHLSTGNFVPANASVILTTWNIISTNYVQPAQVMPANVTLTVPATISGITNFSYDIILVGIE